MTPSQERGRIYVRKSSFRLSDDGRAGGHDDVGDFALRASKTHVPENQSDPECEGGAKASPVSAGKGARVDGQAGEMMCPTLIVAFIALAISIVGDGRGAIGRMTIRAAHATAFYRASQKRGMSLE